VSEKEVSHLFLLDFVEVVDHHSHEQIEDELRSNDHEGDEEEDGVFAMVALRLLARSFGVDALVHHLHPAFGSHHFEEADYRLYYIVKVGAHVHPLAASVCTVV